MAPEDKCMLGFYILCTIVSATISLIGLIKCKDKDKTVDYWMWFLVSWTPGIMIIGGLVVMVGFFILVTEGPVYIINKIKKLT